jgi:hypothetical protein
MKTVFLLATAALLFLGSITATAQDTTSVTNPVIKVDSAKGQIIAVDSTSITNPLPTTIFGVKVPGWAQTFLIALLTLLPAIQLVLKRIPTAYSVKIGGVLGKVLDFLTFFQKDKSANGGTHV